MACANNSSKTNEENVNKKPADLEDLLIKYENFELKNCEEMFNIGNEICDVYLRTLDNAINGDVRAKSDLVDFELFIKRFFEYSKLVVGNCEQEFDVWKINFDNKIANAQKKLIDNNNEKSENSIQLEDSIIDGLTKQIEEMEIDLKNIKDKKNENLQKHNINE